METSTTSQEARRDPPTAELLRDLSQQVSRLVSQEVELAKAELTVKGKRAGVGAGPQKTGGRNVQASAKRQAPVGTGASASTTTKRATKKTFQLDLDNATLLERRNRRGAGGVGVSSPLSGRSNGSPLRMEGLRVNDDDVLPSASPMRVG